MLHTGRVVVVANKYQNRVPRIYGISLISLVLVVLVVAVANNCSISFSRHNMITLKTYS